MEERKYKADAQISTGQFEYIKIEVEDTVQGIIGAYRALKEGYAVPTGLPPNEFQEFLINQLLENSTNHVETLEKMSDFQKKCVNEVKKALNTLSRRNNK